MQTSHGHPLDLRDPASGEPCPMERLADRFMDAPAPKWLFRNAWRDVDGQMLFHIEGSIDTHEKFEEVINYLARVKG
jgi:hypothetical protein